MAWTDRAFGALGIGGGFAPVTQGQGGGGGFLPLGQGNQGFAGIQPREPEGDPFYQNRQRFDEGTFYAEQEAKYAAQAAASAPPSSPYSGPTNTGPWAGASSANGKVSNAGGAWSALDVHNSEIAAASAATGAPANLLKSMVNRESSGNWSANNRIATVEGRDSPMLPFVGIFQSAAESHGLDWHEMIGNKQAQITGMGKILGNLKAQHGSWEKAALVYFGGPAALTPSGFVDEYGMDSQQYGSKAIAGWKYLDEQAGGTYGGVGGEGQSSGPLNIGGVIPGGQVSFAFGAEGGRDFYKYGMAYGMNGSAHTGVDIAGAYGSPVYSPVSGTVVTAGGSGFFTNVYGVNDPNSGEIKIRMDSGAEVVLGHTSSINVKVGQKVSAGANVGGVGWTEGPHIHLEYRVPDSSQSSGFRLVDPGTFAGAVSGGASGGYDAGYAPPQKYGGYAPNSAGMLGYFLMGGR